MTKKNCEITSASVIFITKIEKKKGRGEEIDFHFLSIITLTQVKAKCLLPVSAPHSVQ